jgi:hypothetical protein
MDTNWVTGSCLIAFDAEVVIARHRMQRERQLLRFTQDCMSSPYLNCKGDPLLSVPLYGLGDTNNRRFIYMTKQV